MAKGDSDSYGQYALSGHSSDLVGTIDPFVEIKYKCGHILEKCYKFKVPKRQLLKSHSYF